MTTINYNNKKMKLPFEIKTHSTAMVKRTNPFSGQSTTLPGFAAAAAAAAIAMAALMARRD